MLGVIAVLVNSTMICFVGSTLTEETADSVVDTDGRVGINQRTQVARLWILCLIMEHAILVGKYFMLKVAPSDPKWVDEAVETLKFSLLRWQNEGSNIAQSSNTGDTELAREYFELVDKDKNGELDADELAELCKIMKIDMDADGIAKIIADNNADNSGALSFVEFNDWWIINKDKNKCASCIVIAVKPPAQYSYEHVNTQELMYLMPCRAGTLCVTQGKCTRQLMLMATANLTV